MSTTHPPLYGPAYPDALDDQIRALDADDALSAFADARSRLASDPYRPMFHFSPPQNVMNDPNGLCFWQGRWHLFYQFRPGGEDDRVHWGHTVSDDLAHWRDLPIALYPDTEKDCYSGQALVEDDRVIAIYHGTESGNAIATASDPLLLNWRKHPDNPVIPIVPIDDDGSPYRVFDPCIWRQDDGYYYALSGTYKDGERSVDCQGIDHLFRSRNLAEWEHIGALLEDKLYAERGEDQAVPVFWRLSDKDGKPSGKHMLLLFSHKRSGRCYVGDYEPCLSRFHARLSPANELWFIHNRRPARAVRSHRAGWALHRYFQCQGRQARVRLGQYYDTAAPLLAGGRRHAGHGGRGRC